MDLTSTSKRISAGWISVLVPLVMLYLHAFLFGEWIVDDAGISFAYASNLANGYGMVSQPGVLPVEGYSNTLWVLVLATFVAFGTFDPIWTPKIASLIFVTAAYLILHREMLRSFSNTASLVTLGLLSLQTGFVAWTVSGLENGLLVLLVAFLFSRTLATWRAGASLLDMTVLAFTAFGIALTRPEGVIYAGLVPIFLVLHGNRKTERIEIIRSVLSFFAIFLLLLVGFLAVRIAYFGDLLPNVFYAKGGVSQARLFELMLVKPGGVAKLHHLFSSLFGKWLALWGLIGLVVILLKRVFRSPDSSDGHVTIYLLIELAILTAVGFLLLPYDWMGEYRFATGFYVAMYPLIVGTLWVASRDVPKYSRPIWIASVLVILGITLSTTIPRTRIFLDLPTISIAEVIESESRYDDYSKVLGLDAATLLVADVGGLLLTGNYRIHDLGMLTDRPIARAIGEFRTDPDYESFYDYVFETITPDFISTRAYHSWRANLHGDSRFRSQYVAIVEYEDTWIQDRYGEVRTSGDYVRRDYITAQPEKIQDLRRAAANYEFFGCRDCPRH